MSQMSFEKDLEAIQKELLLLGGMVEKAISTSILALKDLNVRLAKEVIRDDRDIDIQELKIDDMCIKFIALQQPKAMDLRFVTGAMKINNELERMGDYAESIARQALFLSSKPSLKPLVNIPLMAERVQSMVKDSLNAFVQKNECLAHDVIQRDQEVDALQATIYKNLLHDMIRDKDTIERASSLLLTSTRLERIADQSTNICEDIIFMITGESVRHKEKISLNPPQD
ncbi:MAG TPA: phosphate signaling complex protein PhoU [Bdellovibrionota bacterium]|nr:phosphate signaling complex protein PhoU [Bdellovibrionota bacterium]